jgi:hypothetical protein
MRMSAMTAKQPPGQIRALSVMAGLDPAIDLFRKILLEV